MPFRILASLLVVSLVSCGVVAAEPQWQAGTARVNITPGEYMWMSGYGSRTAPASGTLTDLWAKALVLEDGDGQRAVLITLDLVGIGRELSQSVCQALAERYDLKRHQIALCTSHTHTGPVVGRNLGPLHYLLVDQRQKKLIDAYADTLEEQIVAIVGEALERRGPARLTWGSGRATYAVNRRNNREAQVPKLRTTGQLQGPVDHDVPVLAVHDGEGKLQSVVFGYACHATVLSFNRWSGDHPGFAQIELEKDHPGCQAMFFAGCGADQNPLPRRTVELAQHYGRRLATAVDAVLLTSAMKPVAPKLKSTYREINLRLGKLPTTSEIEKDAQSTNKFVAARARMLLDQIKDGTPLSETYPYPVAAWQLGDEVQFVILGGEVVVDFAVRLKSELRGPATWVAGYANDVMAYIPSRRVLREGGYEGAGAMVYYGLPTVWAEQVEEDIVTEVHAQLAGP